MGSQQPKELRLSWAMPDAEADALGGLLLGEDSYDVLVEEDANVYKPNGELLIAFRKGVIPPEAAAVAWPNLRDASKPLGSAGNRGMAAGRGGDDNTRHQRVKRDGTLSNTRPATRVDSGIAGYFDRSRRFPYCRTTAYNLEHPDRFAQALPFIRAVDAVFATEAPERYAAQAQAIAKTHPDFHIHGTVFSTITVNKNWQTAVHKDAGDYKPGLGVMTALRAGDWEGCYLCWPKYRVAVDMRTCDVCLADVHEWHGNTPLVVRGPYERISCVFYYRENMWRCGSAQEELERAKRWRPGVPMYDPVVEEDEHGQPVGG